MSVDREQLDDYFLNAAVVANEANEAARAQSITVVGTASGQIAIWNGTEFQPGSITGSGATGVAVTPTTSPFGLQVALTTVPVANGGTGGTTQATARTGLGLGAMAVAAQIAAVADLAQTISNPPTQAEVQTISTKIDELLGKARTSLALAP